MGVAAYSSSTRTLGASRCPARPTAATASPTRILSTTKRLLRARARAAPGGRGGTLIDAYEHRHRQPHVCPTTTQLGLGPARKLDAARIQSRIRSSSAPGSTAHARSVVELMEMGKAHRVGMDVGLLQVPENRVMGCTSRTWLKVVLAGGKDSIDQQQVVV